MARDPGLEEQMRGDLGPVPGLRERAMFGGLCYLLNGNMLAAVRVGRGMFRVGQTAEAAALALPGVTPMVHGGRRMSGFVWVDAGAMADDQTRLHLLSLAMTYTAALPEKG